MIDEAGAGQLRRFRAELREWLDAHADGVEPRSSDASLEEEVARTRRNQRQLWDEGWLRHGWPASVGGVGGSALRRALVAEEVAARELAYNTVFALTEVLAPTVIAAAPELSARYIEPFLRGDEGWCQGFSEPDAGSDLAALRCRAVEAGDHWVVTGQKIWTSYAQFASRMVLLVRTGTVESRHRGITALLVDMGSPGMTLQPLHAMNDVDEFSETFFDDVRVPKDRVIGAVDAGWAVAMDILRSERGGIFWMLSRWLGDELVALTTDAALSPGDDELLGHAFASIAAVRARSWCTQHRLDAGTMTTPETSIDKILMASAEQELFDLVRSAIGGPFEFEDGPQLARTRSEYFYSRAASIYGGTSEIQRNTVADQVLGLREAR